MRTIIWDVDDVLNAFMREWFTQEWLPQHPRCGITVQELNQNPPHKVLGAALDEYTASIDCFRASPAGRSLEPVPEICEWFARHGEKFRHVALTARPLAGIPGTAEWVFTHFGKWIRTFGFVPSPRDGLISPEYDQDKAGWLQWMRCGHVFVDDNPDNIRRVAALGLVTVTIPQPWNNAAGTLADALRQITTLKSP